MERYEIAYEIATLGTHVVEIPSPFVDVGGQGHDMHTQWILGRIAAIGGWCRLSRIMNPRP